MPGESQFWKQLNLGMKPFWRVRRIENSLMAGTPDVYFTMVANGYGGWIELKHIKRKPRTGLFKISHFTKEQRLFFHIHGSIGGNIWLFLKMEKEYFVFDWKQALTIGNYYISELYDEKNYSWYGRKLDFNRLNLLFSLIKK